MAWHKLHKMYDVSKVGLLLVVCLDKMIGTERGPQQKKGRGAREVELGTPHFSDTCNARGKRWHGTSYIRCKTYQLVFSLRCVFDEMTGTQREPQQKKGRGAREVDLVLHLSLTHVTERAWRKLHKMQDASKVANQSFFHVVFAKQTPLLPIPSLAHQPAHYHARPPPPLSFNAILHSRVGPKS